MDTAVNVVLLRILSRVASVVELVSPPAAEQADQPSRGGIVRRAVRWGARYTLLVALLGSLHTTVGVCPEKLSRWHRGETQQLVAARYTLGLLMMSAADVPTDVVGWKATRPWRLILCRHCHVPLHFEVLTLQHLQAVLLRARWPLPSSRAGTAGQPAG